MSVKDQAIYELIYDTRKALVGLNQYMSASQKAEGATKSLGKSVSNVNALMTGQTFIAWGNAVQQKFTQMSNAVVESTSDMRQEFEKTKLFLNGNALDSRKAIEGMMEFSIKTPFQLRPMLQLQSSMMMLTGKAATESMGKYKEFKATVSPIIKDTSVTMVTLISDLAAAYQLTGEKFGYFQDRLVRLLKGGYGGQVMRGLRISIGNKADMIGMGLSPAEIATMTDYEKGVRLRNNILKILMEGDSAKMGAGAVMGQNIRTQLENMKDLREFLLTEMFDVLKKYGENSPFDRIVASLSKMQLAILKIIQDPKTGDGLRKFGANVAYVTEKVTAAITGIVSFVAKHPDMTAAIVNIAALAGGVTLLITPLAMAAGQAMIFYRVMSMLRGGLAGLGGKFGGLFGGGAAAAVGTGTAGKVGKGILSGIMKNPKALLGMGAAGLGAGGIVALLSSLGSSNENTAAVANAVASSSSTMATSVVGAMKAQSDAVNTISNAVIATQSNLPAALSDQVIASKESSYSILGSLFGSASIAIPAFLLARKNKALMNGGLLGTTKSLGRDARGRFTSQITNNNLKNMSWMNRLKYAGRATKVSGAGIGALFQAGTGIYDYASGNMTGMEALVKHGIGAAGGIIGGIAGGAIGAAAGGIGAVPGAIIGSAAVGFGADWLANKLWDAFNAPGSTSQKEGKFRDLAKLRWENLTSDLRDGIITADQYQMATSQLVGDFNARMYAGTTRDSQFYKPFFDRKMASIDSMMLNPSLTQPQLRHLEARRNAELSANPMMTANPQPISIATTAEAASSHALNISGNTFYVMANDAQELGDSIKNATKKFNSNHSVPVH